jgi:SAM-dependent methyltransferase
MQSYLGDILPKQILDIGAGSGFFSKQLLRRTSAENAICVDTGYQVERDEIFASKSIQFRKQYGSISADLVLLMDVLEHVDDDIGLLKEQISKVPSGTRFLITVPAFAFLWSEHDEFLEHKRRYTLGQLEGLVRETGLIIERGSYYFGFIFPFAAVVRLIGKWSRYAITGPKSDLKQHSRFINRVLSFICRLELPFLPYNRLAGLSAFCLARKRDAGIDATLLRR